MKLSNKQVAAGKTMSYALWHRPEEFGLHRAIEWHLKFDNVKA